MSLRLFDLSGRVAVVVGGTSGIGRALALGLADAGADVVSTGRRAELVDEITGEIERRGRRSIRVTTDVTERSSVEQLRDACASAFAHVDILVCAAGITKRVPTLDMADHSNGGRAIVNDFDIWSDYSRASWDVPHRFVLSGIYELPFFRNSGGLLMRGLLGGWQVSGVATFQSGTPLNVTIQGDRANVGRTPQRPDVLRKVELNCEMMSMSPSVRSAPTSDSASAALYHVLGTAPGKSLKM